MQWSPPVASNPLRETAANTRAINLDVRKCINWQIALFENTSGVPQKFHKKEYVNFIVSRYWDGWRGSTPRLDFPGWHGETVSRNQTKRGTYFYCSWIKGIVGSVDRVCVLVCNTSMLKTQREIIRWNRFLNELNRSIDR